MAHELKSCIFNLASCLPTDELSELLFDLHAVYEHRQKEEGVDQDAEESLVEINSLNALFERSLWIE